MTATQFNHDTSFDRPHASTHSAFARRLEVGQIGLSVVQVVAQNVVSCRTAVNEPRRLDLSWLRGATFVTANFPDTLSSVHTNWRKMHRRAGNAGVNRILRSP